MLYFPKFFISEQKKKKKNEKTFLDKVEASRHLFILSVKSCFYKNKKNVKEVGIIQISKHNLLVLIFPETIYRLNCFCKCKFKSQQVYF